MSFLFLTQASMTDLPALSRLIASLRAFGGELADSPFWVLTEHPQALDGLDGLNARLLPLEVSPTVAGYPFGRKVAACAQAEALAPAGTHTLVYIDPACLIVQPPVLFNLGMKYDAALRPVHIRNVGIPPTAPLDPFWQGIYTAVGISDVAVSVTSFIGEEPLRAYFNSHAFAIRPHLGLMARWYERFQHLLGDQAFQASACADEIHQVFLFQALLSALVAASVDPARLLILPPAYNYPYNLQARVPIERRAAAFDELVCFAYENRSIRPADLTDIQASDQLRSWLQAWEQ